MGVTCTAPTGDTRIPYQEVRSVLEIHLFTEDYPFITNKNCTEGRTIKVSDDRWVVWGVLSHVPVTLYRDRVPPGSGVVGDL